MLQQGPDRREQSGRHAPVCTACVDTHTHTDTHRHTHTNTVITCKQHLSFTLPSSPALFTFHLLLLCLPPLRLPSLYLCKHTHSR